MRQPNAKVWVEPEVWDEILTDTETDEAWEPEETCYETLEC